MIFTMDRVLDSMMLVFGCLGIAVVSFVSGYYYGAKTVTSFFLSAAKDAKKAHEEAMRAIQETRESIKKAREAE